MIEGRAPLFPPLSEARDGEAVRVGERALTWAGLRDAAGAVAERVAGAARVAVWATPELETCVGAVGVLAAGSAVVPINPRSGERELAHVLEDSAPAACLCAPGADPPPAIAALERVEVDVGARGGDLPPPAAPEAPGLVVYTSGTTGPPKGAVLPRRAVASNLDALAEAWEWGPDDVLVHGLPLFHVHGLVLGTLGPVRLGARLHHLGGFEPEAVGAALAGGGTMTFGVPTMYGRLRRAAERSAGLARALGRARLLVSGSAALPATEHEAFERVTGQRIVERYGLTETLMNTAIRAGGERRPGYVGPPLDGVEVRLLDEGGEVIEDGDDETIGDLSVRGPNVMLEYLNRPDATAEAMREGWFHTGDVAARAPDGYIRLVGRRATDLIKSGGYKIGAGEIESALLEHPAVVEAAVTGEPDPDLGERVVAWVVAEAGGSASDRELEDHVARLLAPHKRPRAVRFLDELPRNEMGKVRKAALGDH
jgi:malonyl-CoA/methylmalonyl-CoA synthetase